MSCSNLISLTSCSKVLCCTHSISNSINIPAIPVKLLIKVKSILSPKTAPPQIHLCLGPQLDLSMTGPSNIFWFVSGAVYLVNTNQISALTKSFVHIAKKRITLMRSTRECMDLMQILNQRIWLLVCSNLRSNNEIAMR